MSYDDDRGDSVHELIADYYDGLDPLGDATGGEKGFSDLLAHCRELRDLERRGVIERSVETILARCIIAEAAQKGAGKGES